MIFRARARIPDPGSCRNMDFLKGFQLKQIDFWRSARDPRCRSEAHHASVIIHHLAFLVHHSSLSTLSCDETWSKKSSEVRSQWRPHKYLDGWWRLVTLLVTVLDRFKLASPRTQWTAELEQVQKFRVGETRFQWRPHKYPDGRGGNLDREARAFIVRNEIRI